MGRTKEELKGLQQLPLEVKIALSKDRIREWYDYWKGSVYVSFSGGKDSTVLLDLVRSIYKDIPAVFCDTGLEYPEIRKFALSHENVIRLRPEMRFDEVIKKYGYPVISKEIARSVRLARNVKPGCENSYTKKFDGKLYYKGKKSQFNLEKWKFLLDAPFLISEKCCDIMKKDPAKEFEKHTGRRPFIGTMACESRVRTQVWMRTGCNAYESTNKVSSPLSFWTEQDVLKYIIENNLDYCREVYGEITEQNGVFKLTGVPRTGCMFCMFGCHLDKHPNRFERMKISHPKQYEYCMSKLGIKEVLDYIDVTY